MFKDIKELTGLRARAEEAMVEARQEQEVLNAIRKEMATDLQEMKVVLIEIRDLLKDMHG